MCIHTISCFANSLTGVKIKPIVVLICIFKRSSEAFNLVYLLTTFVYTLIKIFHVTFCILVLYQLYGLHFFFLFWRMLLYSTDYFLAAQRQFDLVPLLDLLQLRLLFQSKLTFQFMSYQKIIVQTVKFIFSLFFFQEFYGFRPCILGFNS